jgi:sulfur-oxidizing protein SoxY
MTTPRRTFVVSAAPPAERLGASLAERPAERLADSLSGSLTNSLTVVGRRTLLTQGGAWGALAACGFGQAAHASAGPELAFDATSLEAALQAMGGHQLDSGQIILSLPETVDDGAFVPVSVTSHLPGTREISIVVEKNPNPLVVQFTLPEGTESQVSTRVKVAESCRVFAVVRTDEKVWSTSRAVQVQRGGCG